MDVELILARQRRLAEEFDRKEEERKKRKEVTTIHLAPPEWCQVEVVESGTTNSGDIGVVASGLAYQRCGGGRRIIRKRLGGS